MTTQLRKSRWQAVMWAFVAALTACGVDPLALRHRLQ